MRLLRSPSDLRVQRSRHCVSPWGVHLFAMTSLQFMVGRPTSVTFRFGKLQKAAALALLDYLVEVDSSRFYATVNACSSLFDYLVKVLGFSHPSAAERVNTVRLMRSIPQVKKTFETSNLTLTSAAQIQRFVSAEQKVHPHGKAVILEKKEEVVQVCLGKSKREVEKTLFEKQSEPARF